MNTKTFIGSMITLTCLGSIGYVNAESYYPPERIKCTIDNASKLSCERFNRNYFIEDATDADLKQGTSETFVFVSAVAIFTHTQEQTSIFFTYHNHQSNLVKLKSINTIMRPDLSHGSWNSINKKVYICNSGYMNCPITDLPLPNNP